MKTANEISKDIDEALGNKITEIKVVMPKAFLANLSKELATSNKVIADAVTKNDNKEELKTLIADNIELKKLYINLEKAIKDSRVDKVEILNPQKQKDIVIPKYPNKIAVNKPTWFKEYSDKGIKAILKNGFQGLAKQLNLDKYTEKKNALAVRLVDKTGKSFYDAMFQAISGGVGNITFPTDYPDAAVAELLTNLSHVGGSTHAIGDIGMVPWGVLQEAPEIAEAGVVDGDYAHMSLTKWHELRTRDQRALSLQDCNDKTDVTVLSNDTTNLADSVNHVFGTGSLSFDKANGADNTVYAGVQETIASIDISEIFEDGAYAAMGMLIPNIDDVKKAFLRIGTDSSNYNTFEWGVSILKANTWMSLRKPLSVPTGYAGNGWDTNAITYLAFGVEFNDEADTLVGIIVDNVHIIGGRVTDTTPNTTIVAAGATTSTNLTRVDTNPVDVGIGNAGLGTQRVSIISNQPSITVDGAFYQVTQPISAAALPLPAGASTSALQLPDGHNVTVDNASIAVTGTFYQVTQPISAAALPLPAGAATSAKQLADGHNVTVDNVGGVEVVQDTVADLKATVELGVTDTGLLDGMNDSLLSLSGAGSPTIDSYTQKSINLTTAADQVLVSSAPSKQIWVYGYAFSCGDADGQTVSLQDEDNLALTGIMEFSQYGGMVVAPSGNFAMPVFKLATDKDLEIDITGGDVDGWLTYAIVSV